jgi:hypothetical protein
MYTSGKTLSHVKYRWIRWSYSSFLVGMFGAMMIFLFGLPIFTDILSRDGGGWQNFKDGICHLSVACRNNL